MKPSKKEFKAIAMKCNQEQFDRIKPKLEEAGVKINDIWNFESCSYLTNAYRGCDCVSNIQRGSLHDFNRTVHETWNEEIFLKSFGIEIETVYAITKEQIIKYDMREEFPEVFSVELEIGKWYKVTDKENFFLRHEYALVMYSETEKHTGFAYRREEWTENFRNLHHLIKRGTDSVEAATHEEVFEALKSEAVRRYKEGDYVNPPSKQWSRSIKLNLGIDEIEFTYRQKELLYCGVLVFSKGKWAETIPTITKEEAEKLLNKKIV